MPISAQVVCDSISPTGKRITTLAIELPKPYLAEFNTHRQFSRSFMSSRAVPVSTFLKRVQEEPYIPIHWGANQKGMQAGKECNEGVVSLSKHGRTQEYNWSTTSKVLAWLDARDITLEQASAFNNAGYHKQVVNRLLEPFSYTVGIVTATEWSNFFQLRDHPAAQPELQALAKAMRKAMDESTPQLLEPGEWHLPFYQVDDLGKVMDYLEMDDFPVDPTPILETSRKVSVARCARVSYQSNSRPKTFTIEEDLALYDRLQQEGHYSPMEHQASPMVENPWQNEVSGVTHLDTKGNVWSNNFQGWVQYRALIQSSHGL